MTRCENDIALGRNLLDGARHFRKTRWRERTARTLWWEPVLTLSAKAEDMRSRDASQPGDEPLFTAREWKSIGVGAIPGVGSGRSVVEVITGRPPPRRRRHLRRRRAWQQMAVRQRGTRRQRNSGQPRYKGRPHTVGDFRFIPPELLPDPPQ